MEIEDPCHVNHGQTMWNSFWLLLAVSLDSETFGGSPISVTKMVEVGLLHPKLFFIIVSWLILIIYNAYLLCLETKKNINPVITPYAPYIPFPKLISNRCCFSLQSSNNPLYSFLFLGILLSLTFLHLSPLHLPPQCMDNKYKAPHWVCPHLLDT